MTPDISWQKSSYSTGEDGAHCVELARSGGAALLRESDAPDAVLATDPERLRNLLQAVKRGGALLRDHA